MNGKTGKRKLRFAAARLLDKRATSVCWAAAVDWAFGIDNELSFHGLINTAHTRGCSQETCCYCGKWRNGDVKNVQ